MGIIGTPSNSRDPSRGTRWTLATPAVPVDWARGCGLRTVPGGRSWAPNGRDEVSRTAEHAADDRDAAREVGGRGGARGLPGERRRAGPSRRRAEGVKRGWAPAQEGDPEVDSRLGEDRRPQSGGAFHPSITNGNQDSGCRGRPLVLGRGLRPRSFPTKRFHEDIGIGCQRSDRPTGGFRPCAPSGPGEGLGPPFRPIPAGVVGRFRDRDREGKCRRVDHRAGRRVDRRLRLRRLLPGAQRHTQGAVRTAPATGIPSGTDGRRGDPSAR